MNKRIKVLLGVLLSGLLFIGCEKEEPQNFDTMSDPDTGETLVYYEGEWLDPRAVDYIQEQEAKAEELEGEAQLYQSVYFIDNGYYFHKDTECKELEGYDYNEIAIMDLIDYQQLDPCNWCATNNESKEDNSEVDESEELDTSSNYIKEKYKEEVLKYIEAKRAEREANGELTMDKLMEQPPLKDNEVVFLLKGYYYHNDPTCEGIKDCYDIKMGDRTKVINELGLKPCNWCSK